MHSLICFRIFYVGLCRSRSKPWPIEFICKLQRMLFKLSLANVIFELLQTVLQETVAVLRLILLDHLPVALQLNHLHSILNHPVVFDDILLAVQLQLDFAPEF